MALTKISTGGVKDDAASQAKIADEAVDEARLQVSNAGSNGQFLQKQSGSTGGLTWAAANEYTHPNHSGEVTSTGDGATVIASNVVDEDNLKVDNSPTNDHVLTAKSSASGGLTWAAVPAGGNSIDLVADGAIAAGKAVIIKSNGKAQQVGLYPSTITNVPDDRGSAEITDPNGATDSSFGLVYNPDRQRLIMSSRGGGGTQENGRLTVFEYSSTLGTDTANDKGALNYVGSSTYNNTAVAYDPDTNQTIVGYNLNNDLYVSLMTLDASDNISYGNRIEVADNVSPDTIRVVYDTNSNRVILIWRDGTNSKIYARAGIANGSTAGDVGNFGTTVQMSGTQTTAKGHMDACWDSTNNKVIIVFKRTDSTDLIKGVVLTCSGTTLTFGSIQTISEHTTNEPRIAFDTDLGKAMMTYSHATNTRLYRQVVWISSGTTLSDGAANEANAHAGDYIEFRGHDTCYDPASKKFYTVAARLNDSKKPIIVQHFINDSNNTIQQHGTFAVMFDGSGNISDDTDSANWAIAPLGSTGKIVCVWRNNSAGNYPNLMLFETMVASSNVTSSNQNFLGFAEDAISDGATGTIKLCGNVVGNQSSLTPGTRYAVNTSTGGVEAGGSASSAGGLAVASDKLLIGWVPKS